MKTRILKIFIPTLIIIFASVYGLTHDLTPSTAFAVGDLTVNWGVPEGNPIFVVTDAAPGAIEQRNVAITNNAPSSRQVAVRAVQSSENPSNFSDELTIEILDGVTPLYSGTLTQFFTDSGGVNGIFLFNPSSGASKNITFKVTFDTAAGNDFQNAQIVFDLKIGISFDLPSECQNINLSGNGGSPIFGTAGVDNLTGTPGNDLIVALEGNDKVEGNSGDDCIIGGLGNDRLNGNLGKDVILGGDGDDDLTGNNEDDYLDGGAGKDNLKGENGQDNLKGGSGSDNLDGGNDNDSLDGGPDQDGGVGGNGIDSCINLESKKSCETP